MQNIFILHDNSGIGLRRDATVLANGLGEAMADLGAPFRIQTLVQPPDEGTSRPPTDSPLWSDSRAWLFHLEQVWTHPRVIHSRPRRDWLVPNPEFLSPDRIRRIVDSGVRGAFAKTDFGYRNLRNRFPRWTILPTGWSSIDLYLEDTPKSFRRFLHVRGQSRARQTERLIECWTTDPSLPELTVSCFVNTTASGANVDFPVSPNLRVVKGKLPLQTLRQLMNETGIHICCSRMEGFGHYINEARSTGACILVTSGPPMTELVGAQGGFLIPVEASLPLNLSQQHHVTPAALADTVRRVLATPVPHLERMGQYNRERFIADHRRFVDKLKRWARTELARQD